MQPDTRGGVGNGARMILFITRHEEAEEVWGWNVDVGPVDRWTSAWTRGSVPFPSDVSSRLSHELHARPKVSMSQSWRDKMLNSNAISRIAGQCNWLLFCDR